ncbi:MAG TPA: helix-turn-helix domain-containing protein [Lysobacter sp.]|nr:helix-turn-helix domain-containing protein [Lysobacter sp.]
MTDTHSAGAAAGERLKRAREAAGMSLGDASSRLKLPIRALDALERGEWESLGPPVFVRGQARSYARMLGVDLDDGALPSPFTTTQIPSLVSHVHVPRYRHVAENLARRAVYVVLTVSLVVPVWLATRGHGGAPEVASLDVAPSQAADAAAPVRTPMVASIAPLTSEAAAAAALELVFEGESWVQVFAPDGSVLEKGLLRAGERRVLKPSSASRLVLGNATAVRAQLRDQPVDLAPYTRANVARFTLSSDGSLAPSAP